MKKIDRKSLISNVIAVVLTIFSSAVIALGVKIFLSPNRYLSIGVQGLTLIIGRVFDNITGLQLETTIAGVSLFVFNIPILLLAWKKLSLRFMILSVINVAVNTLVMTLLPDNLHEVFHLSVANGDITFLDAALFVGLMNGTANAISYVVGGSTGGADVMSMYYSIKKQGTVGSFTTIINSAIILIGLFVDGTDGAIAKAFYTLVYLVINSLVIDIFYTRNKRAVLLITTTKGEEVADVITHQFIRGATIMNAKGAYTGADKNVLYCACSSFEVANIAKKVKEIDEHAFISVLDASKIHGNFLSKELR